MATYPWAPTAADVARVSNSYTQGGFDDDEESSGSMKGEFTESTEPSISEVEDMIVTACDEVQGRVGIEIPLKDYKLAKTTAMWHVAAAIAGDKTSSGSDDASGEYRSKILNFRNSLDSLVYLSRIPAAMRLK